MNDIVITSLYKNFGEKQIFENLNISFKAGSRTAIMAKSGRGKSTLVKMIAGIDKQFEGDISGAPENIAMVFQEDRLCESFSAGLNISLSGNADESEINSILEQFDMSGEIKTKVINLSGGMKRKVAIARALLADSELLILDEPFTGLDTNSKEKVAKTILDYSKDKTVIIITHNNDEAKLLHAEVQMI